jgi:hypothetical protein
VSDRLERARAKVRREALQRAKANGRPEGQPGAPRPVPPYKPFPLPLLPPALRQYVDASASAIGCDAALVALPALAVAASCVGNARALRLKHGWSEPAIVWAVTVAPSGAQKSPAYAAAVNPLYEIQMDAVDAAGEGKPPRYVTSDATVQAVGELLRDNPRGVLMARDELDGWFQSFTRYSARGASDRPQWLELHRAGTLLLDRVTRERGALRVRRACCSVCGTIQPQIYARALDAEALAAGLGARFLAAAPPPRRRKWTEAEVEEGLAEGYKRLLTGLLALPLADLQQRKPHFLSLDAPAKAAWVRWYDGWAARQAEAPAEEAALLAKLEGYAARLALVHRVCACTASCDTSSCTHWKTVVTEDSLLAGVGLAEWFAGEAERVGGVLRETSIERERRELLDWADARGGRVTVRDVNTGLHRRYPTADDAEAALQGLVGAGLGRWETQPPGASGGRATRVFVSGSGSGTHGFSAENEGSATAAASDGEGDGYRTDDDADAPAP